MTLPQARLQHILEQIDGIAAATQGLAFAQVDSNFLYERAVGRAVQIISEAAKELPLKLRNKYPDVHRLPALPERAGYEGRVNTALSS